MIIICVMIQHNGGPLRQNKNLHVLWSDSVHITDQKYVITGPLNYGAQDNIL